ncbi:MAG: competence/damage-inducible protein A [Halodesulfurarchaeum sp.]
MDVAIVTVGDELLSGETENTNASWLARTITEQGGTVERILAVGDDRETIARYVEIWAETFDAVVVSGGLGGTHDDVTMAAVADAFERDLVIDPQIRSAVVASSRSFVEDHPDLADRYDLGLDPDAWAEIVDGGEVLENPEGLSPGCVVSNVYVLPGVPSEMRAVFESVASEFGGDRVSTTLSTDAPESALIDVVEELRAQFDVSVGIYPGERGDPNRVTIRGTDGVTIERARDWLADRIDTIST